MIRTKKTALWTYKGLDYLSAMVAWFIFYAYRKKLEAYPFTWDQVFEDRSLYIGLAVIPIFWVVVYHVFDKYQDVFRFSRLAALKRTLLISFFGSIVLLFTVLLDDTVLKYINYFMNFTWLFGTHFLITATVRMIFLSFAKKKVKQGQIRYNTLIVGGDTNAIELVQEIESMPFSMGHNILGFIDSNGKSKNHLAKTKPLLGSLSDIPEVLQEYEIDDVVIAVETSEHQQMNNILNILFDARQNVAIKVIPDMYDIMLGTVKMSHIYGAVLIEIEQELMPKWERVIKRMMDIVVSVLGLLVTSPVLLFSAIKVQGSSEGPVFYKQDRVGKNGESFEIIKFRSMYTNAEASGPQLSSDNDPRITPYGAIMRKWRIDELPQFWNVLRGDMSLVGPRPERQHFIDLIAQKAPHVKQLTRVRPGITSWGQVKYGYASTVEEMIQRLKFDILYIENMSLGLDFKILVYTVLVLFQGKGK